MSIGIGLVSFWHVHAWDYVKQAQAHEDTFIAAVWDEDVIRGQEAAETLKVPYFESLDDMLARRMLTLSSWMRRQTFIRR